VHKTCTLVSVSITLAATYVSNGYSCLQPEPLFNSCFTRDHNNLACDHNLQGSRYRLQRPDMASNVREYLRQPEKKTDFRLRLLWIALVLFMLQRRSALSSSPVSPFPLRGNPAKRSAPLVVCSGYRMGIRPWQHS
jgi:hypothetical protein